MGRAENRKCKIQYLTTNIACPPFISDSEASELFGPALNSYLQTLDSLNKKGNYCKNCNASCCEVSGCEIYTGEFDSCPIYEYRPIACRLYYCKSFQPFDENIIREFQYWFDCHRNKHQRARLFNGPPFSGTAQKFIDKIEPFVQDVRNGNRKVELAKLEIKKELQTYIRQHDQFIFSDNGSVS